MRLSTYLFRKIACVVQCCEHHIIIELGFINMHACISHNLQRRGSDGKRLKPDKPSP